MIFYNINSQGIIITVKIILMKLIIIIFIIIYFDAPVQNMRVLEYISTCLTGTFSKYIAVIAKVKMCLCVVS
jgi:hypothetical protein